MPYRQERNRLSKALSSMINSREEEKPFGMLHGDIKTWRDPYEEGYSTTYARNVQFHPGVTILVGCNGCGKTTLIQNIKSLCRSKNVAYLKYDNLRDGGDRSFSSALFFGHTSTAATLWSSSEGERISCNIGLFLNDIGKALRTDMSDAPEIWLLLDATDSGLSIDNIEELKQCFRLILDDNGDRDVYIVAAANEYELARGERCLDVMTGKEITFRDYDEYRDFILKSRERKDKRIQKARENEHKKDGKDE